MNEQNNFEKACFEVCNTWADGIEMMQEPVYSTKHIKKIKSMSNGIIFGNVCLNRKNLMILVACILILAMNIVAFAYIGSRSKAKSKDLVFYVQNPVKIGEFKSGSSICVRVSGASDYKNEMAIDDLEYGYIPEDYKEVFECGPELQKRLWTNVYGEYIYYRREFRKHENGEDHGWMSISKVIESNGMNLRDSVIYMDGDKTGEELKDDILNNNDVETVSPDIYEFMENVIDFEENGIHYYFISSNDEKSIGGELLWNNDGYLYILTGYSCPLEELKKTAKDIK